MSWSAPNGARPSKWLGAGLVLFALLWAGPGAWAGRALVTLRLSGPHSEEASKRLAGALGSMGVGIASASRPRPGRGRSAGGPALVRGSIAQLRGFWALRLSVRSADGRSLGGRTFPLRGARLDPHTARQAARMVARLVVPRRKPRVRVRRRSRAKAPPKNVPLEVQFERRGDQVVVPVKLIGPRGEVAVRMRLAREAPFTTVTRATLQRLGVAASLAKLRFKSPRGLVRRPISVLDGISVGGAEVRRGLTVGVCDACAGAGIEGQLGKNFIRNFTLSEDAAKSRLLLRPRRLKDPDTYDVSPFLQLLSIDGTAREDKLATSFVLKNRSHRVVRDVVISIHVAGLDPAPTTTIARLGPGAEQAVEVVSPQPRPGAGTPKLRLRRAGWLATEKPEQGGDGKGPRLAPTASPIYVDPARRSERAPTPEQDDLGFIVAEPGQ